MYCRVDLLRNNHPTYIYYHYNIITLLKLMGTFRYSDKENKS